MRFDVGGGDDDDGGSGDSGGASYEVELQAELFFKLAEKVGSLLSFQSFLLTFSSFCA